MRVHETVLEVGRALIRGERPSISLLDTIKDFVSSFWLILYLLSVFVSIGGILMGVFNFYLIGVETVIIWDTILKTQKDMASVNRYLSGLIASLKRSLDSLYIDYVELSAFTKWWINALSFQVYERLLPFREWAIPLINAYHFQIYERLLPFRNWATPLINYHHFQIYERLLPFREWATARLNSVWNVVFNSLVPFRDQTRATLALLLPYVYQTLTNKVALNTQSILGLSNLLKTNVSLLNSKITALEAKTSPAVSFTQRYAPPLSRWVDEPCSSLDHCTQGLDDLYFDFLSFLLLEAIFIYPFILRAREEIKEGEKDEHIDCGSNILSLFDYFASLVPIPKVRIKDRILEAREDIKKERGKFLGVA